MHPWQQTHHRVDAIEGILANLCQKLVLEGEIRRQGIKQQLLFVGAALEASEVGQQRHDLANGELPPKFGKVPVDIHGRQWPRPSKPAIQAFTFRDHAHACLIQAEEEGDDAVCRHWIDTTCIFSCRMLELGRCTCGCRRRHHNQLLERLVEVNDKA